MGIYDRDYYRSSPRGGFGSFNMMTVTTWLIIINVIVYLLDQMSNFALTDIGCFATHEALVSGVAEIAVTIAAKSSLAVRGCKEMITYARDHSVADGLNYIATWNAAMLLSEDLTEALAAAKDKRAPRFKN